MFEWWNLQHRQQPLPLQLPHWLHGPWLWSRWVWPLRVAITRSVMFFTVATGDQLVQWVELLIGNRADAPRWHQTGHDCCPKLSQGTGKIRLKAPLMMVAEVLLRHFFCCEKVESKVGTDLVRRKGESVDHREDPPKDSPLCRVSQHGADAEDTLHPLHFKSFIHHSIIYPPFILSSEVWVTPSFLTAESDNSFWVVPDLKLLFFCCRKGRRKKKASSSKHPRGWMGKLEYLEKTHTISLMPWKPYDITLDEGFTAIKVQENKTTTTTKGEVHFAVWLTGTDNRLSVRCLFDHYYSYYSS